MICLPLVLLPLAHAPTLTPPPPTLPAGVTIEQRLVVGMPPGAPLPPILFLVYGATLVDTIPELDAHLLDVPAAVDLDALIALLVGSQGAAYAEGDRNSGSPDTACSQGPGDPWDSAGQQCTIGFADGTPSHKEYKQQSMLRQIRAEQAQAASTGAPNVVAVIDTGVDLGHPTLAGKLVSTGFDYILGVPLAQDAPNFLDDDGDGTVDEGTGHGTHIAGIIVLVNPAAQILPLRVLDSEGNGWGFDVARALVDAGNAGVDIVNLSLALNQHSRVVEDALEHTLGTGAAIFASAGNHGAAGAIFPSSHGHVSPPAGTDPCTLPLGGASATGVVSVGAVDPLDSLASFSAFGDGVDLVTPGVSIYGPDALLGAQLWSGTSQATAVASGAASLLLSVNPSLAASPALPLILGADDVSAENPAHPCELGAGRIKLQQSLNHL